LYEESSAARWDLTSDRSMAQAVRMARIPLCITDPNQPDNPIIFANTAFLDLTGYSEAEVIGNNCRFLQGPDTTPQSIFRVRKAIEDQRVETVEIINYRKDGSRFVNALQIGPILDEAGEMTYCFGSQLDVTETRDAEERARKLANDELIHRLGNVVNVMTVIIRLTAREEEDTYTFGAKVAGRLRALSDAHLQTINRPEGQAMGLRELARTTLLAYAPLGQDQFTLTGPEAMIPKKLNSFVALGLHELATNLVKHGALSSATGRVALNWENRTATGGAGFSFRWEEAGGPRVVRSSRRSGSRMISELASAMGGNIEFDWQDTGLIARAEFPD